MLGPCLQSVSTFSTQCMGGSLCCSVAPEGEEEEYEEEEEERMTEREGARESEKEMETER